MNKLSDIRDIFFENIKKKFLTNKNYFILTNDADVFSLKSLRKNRRFIDAGVAEQNLINIASGLAKNNKKPIVYGFCTFLTFRCYEQLRFSIASNSLDVKIIGVGPGFSFSYDGPTHHGTQDLYLMYLIPEFEIINISDNNLAHLISKNINKIKGPTYIRIDKGIMNFNENIKYNIKQGFALTFKAKIKKNIIISTGYFCKIANEVAIKRKDVSVINLFRLKKFDKISFIKELKKYKKIILFDESSKFGGITPIILNMINDFSLKIKIDIMASKDEQIFRYSNTRDEFLKMLKLNEKNLQKLLL
ncbi:transketolase C-terminal domain-containing protein [Candidatus Pelagibacter communis]|uniref:transketolase C-terminal domain-containing protein n=1 Tax=Pelagibacter ubique TaxID=198252 RepID=UPI00094C6B62|nr:transketolase C-terminal domain-containing protein [Candidatus Pelagibacter ubique]